MAHVYNVINGKVKNVSRLPAIAIGRRKLIQRDTLEDWKKSNEQGETDVMILSYKIDAVRRMEEHSYAKRVSERSLKVLRGNDVGQRRQNGSRRNGVMGSDVKDDEGPGPGRSGCDGGFSEQPPGTGSSGGFQSSRFR